MMKYLSIFAVCAFALTFVGPVYGQETTTEQTTTETTTTEETTTTKTEEVTVVEATVPVSTKAPQSLVEKYRTRFANLPTAVKKHPVTAIKRYATANSSCIQKAVDTREASIATAWGTFSTSITSALATRQKALFDAWGGSEEGRGVAIKSAWSAWKKSQRDAFSKLRSDRNAAWKTFRDTVKAECKIALPKEEELAKDATGSTAL